MKVISLPGYPDDAWNVSYGCSEFTATYEGSYNPEPISYSITNESTYTVSPFPEPKVILYFAGGLQLNNPIIVWDPTTYDLEVAGTYTVEGYYEYVTEEGIQHYPVQFTLEVRVKPVTLTGQFRRI